MTTTADRSNGARPGDGASAPLKRGPNVLLLADNSPGHAATVLDHIGALTELSYANVFVYNPRDISGSMMLDLDEFDAVVIHYSLVIIGDSYLAPSFRRKLRNYRGLKIQFIQDDYRWVDEMTEMMRYLGIHVLFTLVPRAQIPAVWKEEALPGVRKIHTLAGYVPEGLVGRPVRPIRERPIDVGYRGRTLPFWLGRLAQEKVIIGREFAARAAEHGLNCDIGWRESDRVYGGNWINFIGSCRATLGTESGASITDFDGSVERRVKQYLRRRPGADFEEVFDAILAPYEGNVKFNVISPRIFEAIALRTPLVLFPGEYSGVVEPWRHYIPLEKDFSNMAAVVEKIRDTGFLEALAERAYEDIVVPGRYSFRVFVEEFDAVLREMATRHGREGKLRYRLALREPNPAVVKARLWQGVSRLLPNAPQAGYFVAAARLLATHPDLPRVWGQQRVTGTPDRSRFLLKDLLRLSVIHKLAQRVRTNDDHYVVTLVYEADRRALVFRSHLCDDELELGPPPSEAELLSLLDSGKVERILWDHTPVDQSLRFYFSWFAHMHFEMGGAGLYEFVDFAALANADPVLGARCLSTTIEGSARGIGPTRVTAAWLRETRRRRP